MCCRLKAQVLHGGAVRTALACSAIYDVFVAITWNFGFPGSSFEPRSSPVVGIRSHNTCVKQGVRATKGGYLYGLYAR